MNALQYVVLVALVCPVLGPVDSADADYPALHGLDPVELCEGNEVEGSPYYPHRRGRLLYHFASEESRARFLAEPDRFEIQWGGACGRMGPLSGIGNPGRYLVHDGRIWVFASDDCRSSFAKAPETYVTEDSPHRPSKDEVARGRRLLAQVLEAHGGAEAIDAASELRVVHGSTTQGWRSELATVVSRERGVWRSSVWTPPADSEQSSMSTTWVASSDDAFTVEGEDVHDLVSAAQHGDLRRFAHRLVLPLLWARGEPGFEVHVRDGEPRELVVRYQGLTTTLKVHGVSHRVFGVAWRGRITDGVTRDVDETFAESRSVNGVLVPASRSVLVDGEFVETRSATFAAIEVTAGAHEALFHRPPK